MAIRGRTVAALWSLLGDEPPSALVGFAGGVVFISLVVPPSGAFLDMVHALPCQVSFRHPRALLVVRFVALRFARRSDSHDALPPVVAGRRAPKVSCNLGVGKSRLLLPAGRVVGVAPLVLALDDALSLERVFHCAAENISLEDTMIC